MSVSNLPFEKTNRPSEFDYFNVFYQPLATIDGTKYDAVYTFFLSRTNNNESAAKSLTASLLQIAYSTGIDPMVILDDFKKYNKNESFKTALIGLFNSSRRSTSKLGFSSNPIPSPLVIRNIRN
jgi:hypothetical protein